MWRDCIKCLRWTSVSLNIRTLNRWLFWRLTAVAVLLVNTTWHSVGMECGSFSMVLTAIFLKTWMTQSSFFPLFSNCFLHRSPQQISLFQFINTVYPSSLPPPWGLHLSHPLSKHLHHLSFSTLLYSNKPTLSPLWSISAAPLICSFLSPSP